MSAEQRRAWRGGDQLSILLGLWWRHMRRRPRRLGDLPKESGAPTFLLINLLSLGYLVPLAFASIKASIAADVGNFAGHALGVVAVALGAGLSSRGLTLQGRARDDLFLETLPLSLSARLGLTLLDGYLAIVFAFIVPLAGLVALGDRGGQTVPVVLFGWLLYLSVFVAGSALRAWLRVFGPPATARVTGYVGTGVKLAGFGLVYFPLSRLVPDTSVARIIAEAWLVDDATLGALYGAAALLGLCAYGALVRAERRGYDRLDLAASAPRQRQGLRSRHALEALLVWRQGGKLLLLALTVLLLVAVSRVLLFADERVPKWGAYHLIMGLIVYIGSLQSIGLAGRSARSDLVARPFLATLPLAPHQVLEGKAVVLRWLLVPVFVALALSAIAALLDGFLDIGLRALLASVALYVVVAGAVAIAFLSSGVGVAGVAGGQAGSSFSTQLLLMPMMATVFARDAAAASVSLIAVVAVTREALRAARLSVRWIDDSDDDAERETSVWRALLAATVFFSTQMFSVGVLRVFEIHGVYAQAIGFAFAAGVLVLLTLRSRERFDKPLIAPRWPWYLPLGLLAGAASGRLAVWAIQLRTDVAPEPDRSTLGETAALLVTMVLVAPLAEEYFFRGWLQKAIEEDLPQQHKRWAFALGALAFALAHVGGYGVPQLVVGLIAGWLYANGGGLASAVLAHAAHNATVMYFGVQS
jgi:membrane protease YdiL (CAAX protease family)